jgi:hypothetical protein
MVEETNNRHEDLDTLQDRLTPEHIKAVDAHYHSPKERSARVLTLLETGDFTRWDYLCFSVEFLGQFVLGYFTHDEILSAITKRLGAWLYNMHYFYNEDIYGAPEEGKKK